MPIEGSRAKELISTILKEVSMRGGYVRLDDFASLRDVDAKVREFKIILRDANAGPLLEEIERDPDFSANSRRVRLEALSNYCRTALKFFDDGIIQQEKRISPAPTLTKLTHNMPELEAVLQQRWLEAQKCQRAESYVAAVVMMGSVLEALLLARCLLSSSEAYTPKDKTGKNTAIPHWNLHSLVEVSVDCGWLKSDRGKFSHALRESRNIVHPYEHARSKANFDESTCATCWHVLNASVEDLLASIP
jgi:hypothetical protein